MQHFGSDNEHEAGRSAMRLTSSPLCRMLALGLALGGLFLATQERTSSHAQRKKPPSSDVPSPQLLFVSRLPPDQWLLEGAVASSDFIRLLLRSRADDSQTEGFWTPVPIYAREYEPNYFQTFQSPNLIKLELGESGPAIIEAPQRLVMMAGSFSKLPVLVRNKLPEAAVLTIETPLGDHNVSMLPSSVRGYCLNLTPARPGRQTSAIRLATKGGNTSVPIDLDIRATGHLRVQLLDENGPTAARVYVTGADGLAHTPLGSLQRILKSTGRYFFYSDDRFELPLPEGKTKIEVIRGMEYAPVVKEVEVRAGETVDVSVRLDHRLPMYKEGWYSADSHIHANYRLNEIVTLEDIALQTRGEGLNVANLMVANSSVSTNTLHDVRFFEGKPNAVSQGRYVLYWNEEVRNNFLYGHMCFFNLKKLVHPAFTGFPGTPNFEDYPPNFEQARAAQLQNGAVTYAHPAMEAKYDPTKSWNAQEFPVDLALGVVDSLDVISSAEELASMELWYRVLNAGLKCGISAGMDCFTNFMVENVPGGGRVYVSVPGEFSHDKWITNYKKGKTFATNGPMLTLSVNGQQQGEELRIAADGGRATVKVAARARSVAPMQSLEVVINGAAVAMVTAEGSYDLKLEKEIVLDQSAWIAARALGPSHPLVVQDRIVFAHTSPVYCLLDDRPIRSPQDALFWADWIEKLIKTVERAGVFADPQKRQSVVDLFEKARQVYVELAGHGGKQ